MFVAVLERCCFQKREFYGWKVWIKTLKKLEVLKGFHGFFCGKMGPGFWKVTNLLEIHPLFTKNHIESFGVGDLPVNAGETLCFYINRDFETVAVWLGILMTTWSVLDLNRKVMKWVICHQKPAYAPKTWMAQSQKKNSNMKKGWRTPYNKKKTGFPSNKYLYVCKDH